MSITRLRRKSRPALALTSTTDIAIEFDEINVDTGCALEETFSFAKVGACSCRAAFSPQAYRGTRINRSLMRTVLCATWMTRAGARFVSRS